MTQVVHERVNHRTAEEARGHELVGEVRWRVQAQTGRLLCGQVGEGDGRGGELCVQGTADSVVSQRDLGCGFEKCTAAHRVYVRSQTVCVIVLRDSRGT